MTKHRLLEELSLSQWDSLMLATPGHYKKEKASCASCQRVPSMSCIFDNNMGWLSYTNSGPWWTLTRWLAQANNRVYIWVWQKPTNAEPLTPDTITLWLLENWAWTVKDTAVTTRGRRNKAVTLHQVSSIPPYRCDIVLTVWTLIINPLNVFYSYQWPWENSLPLTHTTHSLTETYVIIGSWRLRTLLYKLLNQVMRLY